MKNRFRAEGWEEKTYVMQTKATDVIFRRSPYNNKIIAIFPAIADAGFGINFCKSCVDDNFGLTTVDIFKDTLFAAIDDSEVVSFISDLESIGYKLNIVEEFMKKHENCRKKCLT